MDLVGCQRPSFINSILNFVRSILVLFITLLRYIAAMATIEIPQVKMKI